MEPRTAYNLGYRYFRMPWEIGPRAELVELVETGRLRPGRAIDLGCGTGANAVFLARHGFEVTARSSRASVPRSTWSASPAARASGGASSRVRRPT